jgi:hypothetical protein
VLNFQVIPTKVGIQVFFWLIRFKRIWRGMGSEHCEPPASFGRSRRQDRKGKHFVKQVKIRFPKDCLPMSGERIIAVRREVFWLPHLSSGSQKYFLGVLRALSEAGGSFFKSILQPDESFSLVFDCPVLLGNHASRLCAVTSVIAGAGQAGTGARTRACISPP